MRQAGAAESRRAILDSTQSCPGCLAFVFKQHGCDQMFCTKCNTFFSFETGQKVTSGAFHNPHFFALSADARREVLERNGVAQQQRQGAAAAPPPPAAAELACVALDDFRLEGPLLAALEADPSVDSDELKFAYKFASRLSSETLREIERSLQDESNLELPGRLARLQRLLPNWRQVLPKVKLQKLRFEKLADDEGLRPEWMAGKKWALPKGAKRHGLSTVGDVSVKVPDFVTDEKRAKILVDAHDRRADLANRLAVYTALCTTFAELLRLLAAGEPTLPLLASVWAAFKERNLADVATFKEVTATGGGYYGRGYRFAEKIGCSFGTGAGADYLRHLATEAGIPADQR